MAGSLHASVDGAHWSCHNNMAGRTLRYTVRCHWCRKL